MSHFLFLVVMYAGPTNSLLILKSGTQLECTYYKAEGEWVIVQLADGFHLPQWKGPRKFKVHHSKIDWEATKTALKRGSIKRGQNIEAETIAEIPASKQEQERESSASKVVESQTSSQVRPNSSAPDPNPPKQVPRSNVVWQPDSLKSAEGEHVHSGDQKRADVELSKPREPETILQKRIVADDLIVSVDPAPGSMVKRNPESKPQLELLPLNEKEVPKAETLELDIPFEVDGFLSSNVFQSVRLLESRSDSVKVRITGFFSGQETVSLKYDLTLVPVENPVGPALGRDEFMISVQPQKTYMTELWVRLEPGANQRAIQASIVFKEFF